MSNPYNAYRQSQLLAASPLQLVHLAYEGAISAIVDAQNSRAPEHLSRRKAAITKAQLIIGELRRTLDFANGGDIAVQLGRLYDYMQSELRAALFSPNEGQLLNVQRLLSTLGEAWGQISVQAQPAAVTMPATYGTGYEEGSYARAVYSL